MIRVFFSIAWCGLLVLSGLGSLAMADEGAAPWRYYHSFENGLIADFALGARRADSDGRTCVVATADAAHAKVLSVPQSDHFAIPLKGNLSFEEGTLRMDVSPRFTLPQINPGYGSTQMLFNATIRSGPTFSLKVQVIKGKPFLVLEVKNARDQKASRLALEIDDWQSGSWHEIAVAWKQPGTLSLSADDKTKTIADAHLPAFPAAMLYDLFIGSNSRGTSGLGDTQHADFYFDNIAVFDRYDYLPEAGMPLPKMPAVDIPATAHKNPRWVGKNRHRINVFTTKTKANWSHTPITLDVNFGAAWDQLDGAGRRAAIDSLRLVRYDLETGEPIVFDPEKSGDERYFMPFRHGESLYWQGEGTLSWSRAANEAAAYALYYDEAAPYSEPFPKTIPMTGDGDRLQLGLKGDKNKLSLGIAGSFEPMLGADGKVNALWGNIGTLQVPAARDLGYGFYYFERLEDDADGTPVFAPGQFIYRGSTPHGGLLHANTLLNIADINGDGKPEFIYSGFRVHEWWEYQMKNGRPEITAQHPIVFKGKPPAGETKSRVYDFDGDGLLDLQLGRKLLRNIGTATAPVFDAENAIDLPMDSPVDYLAPNAAVTLPDNADDIHESIALEWLYFPVDWDGDGVRDIVSSSTFPYLFFRKNTGTDSQPYYAKRERLKAADGENLAINTMLVRTNVMDWDGTGALDILFGGEEGYIGLIRNKAAAGEPAQLEQPVFFKQINAPLDAGSLAIPTLVDWRDNGVLDIVVGNSAGHLLRFENKGTQATPIWGAGEYITTEDGAPIYLIAEHDGSVQGAFESYWGYQNPIVVDWDGDGLKDIITSGNRMTHHFYKNIGEKGAPKFAKGQLLNLKNPPRDAEGKRTDLPWGLRYEPQGNELITVHRSRAQALDWNGDGVMDYIAIDHKNELALYLGERTEDGEIVLGNPQNIFTIDGPNARGIVWNRPTEKDAKLTPGSYGRTIVNIVDWNNDGKFDLVYDNVNGRYYENISDNDHPHFVDRGDLVDARLANHNNGPEVVDWDGDGMMDLFVGAESGRIYYFHRSYIEGDTPAVGIISTQDKP